jgi:uncharacterized protein (UPF0210 family)
VENMGVSKIGLHGSLAAAAILTEAVDRADFPHTGFSGFMQPILEDSVLAQRAAEGTLTIKDALLYSTMRYGLDTVPLPGIPLPNRLRRYCWIICAGDEIGQTLTARLMPVPGQKAGDRHDFDSRLLCKQQGDATESENSQARFQETISSNFQPGK